MGFLALVTEASTEGCIEAYHSYSKVQALTILMKQIEVETKKTLAWHLQHYLNKYNGFYLCAH